MGTPAGVNGERKATVKQAQEVAMWAVAEARRRRAVTGERGTASGSGRPPHPPPAGRAAPAPVPRPRDGEQGVQADQAGPVGTVTELRPGGGAMARPVVEEALRIHLPLRGPGGVRHGDNDALVELEHRIGDALAEGDGEWSKAS